MSETSPSPRRVHPPLAAAVEVWKDDGGVHGLADSPAGASPMTPGALLERLGAALLAEWHALPTPVQKAVYGRAVDADAGPPFDAAHRQIARLLHEHMAGARAHGGPRAGRVTDGSRPR